MIYHLVTRSDLRAQLEGPVYRPANLAADGFVHCAEESSLLPVADDYYQDVAEPLLLLEIDPGLLSSETRFEAPAPIPGGGTNHLRDATQFPHVYGPIDVDAILRVGVLTKSDAGFEWPTELIKLPEFLDQRP